MTEVHHMQAGETAGERVLGNHWSEPASHAADDVGARAASLQLPRRLSYSCTQEEIEEGQKLAVVVSYGGSARRASVCTLILLAATFLLLWFQVGPGHRLWLILGLAPFVMLATVLRTLKRKRPDVPVELEINQDGIRAIDAESSSTFPGASCEKLTESENLFALKCGKLLVFLPKRAFASDSERDGFRTLAAAWCESAGDTDVRDAEVENNPADDVSVTFRLRFRDYVDRTLVSWLARSICAGLFLLMCVRPILAEPREVVSQVEVLARFTVLMVLVGTPLLFSLVCLGLWLSDLSHRCETHVAIGDGGIRCRTPSEDNTLTWSKATRFKESGRSFYVWWPGTRAWILVPKRAFASEAEVQQCRALLATHAEESTWFWS